MKPLTESQSYPAWITYIFTCIERQIRKEKMKSFEESQMPNTCQSTLLNHVRPAPRKKLGRLSESLLVQFRTGTSKHFGRHSRVLTQESQSIRLQMVLLKA
ncbi:hypothetical protein, unlikely [Trypanosoma congolense IL3000]|uniref:Uncharacterized protein n=1 Tax=Trypanosoma congolense (strain IL3000) TaxID=1068625 RepID=F9WIV0_TRYCI|nr:hypothetical protein, unlikely [Trypanosoma congolense IL3000]